MVIFPKAKINIGLRITRKRDDGFHDIETLYYPLSMSDALEFVISDDKNNTDQITVTGISTGSTPEDNIISKTIRLLRRRYDFPILKIHLHKAIPVGAGLGGGSSDAICLLNSLNKCFNLKIDTKGLADIALELGSDCPFFIDSTPSYATGRGEILRPIDPVLKGYYILLFKPEAGINTKEAYENCIPVQPSSSLLTLIELPLPVWKEEIINDFEDFAVKKYPVIGEIKDTLYQSGALFSSMSGSGSSVYGIFSEKPPFPASLQKHLIFEGFL